ncbi:MAG: tripartite tricarboxylate transporter TctB family protein [Kocuria sp.]|uniref:Tripartite tricarboxylate transporter TctB family protein n=1 Tax=Kocuria salsicia TaxID=664639 RepID=A0ABV3KHT0_9MICC|nr:MULTISPECIES: tripartite tricarboxylate transporter TctB family protein [Kocuria]MBS6031325.1 tripartite tricarboxylate transporter TctB family protein [Kocuria rhizophila]MDO4257129.1 tripartite tricarboxylate transporter TctB family protein [Kocuria sp.]
MTQQVAGADSASVEPPSTETAPARPFLLGELTMPLVFTAFATYLLVGLLSMSVPDSVDFPGPRFFPATVVGVVYGLVVLDVLVILRRRRAAGSAHEKQAGKAPSGSTAVGAADTTAPGDDAAPRFSWRSFAWVVGGFLVFALLLEFLGWIIGAALLFWCVARGFGAARPLLTLVVGLTVSSLAYIAFDMALGLSLPSGILGGGF